MNQTKHYRGQSIVEFALIFPLVFFLLLGFLDLGRAVFYYSTLSNSIREATRYAIVNDPEGSTYIDDVKSKVWDYLIGIPKCDLSCESGDFTIDDISVTVTVEDGSNIKVSSSATYCFIPITPGIKQIVGSSCEGIKAIGLNVQSTMRFEPVFR